MTNVAAQERVQAYAGMSVETVKAQGSEGIIWDPHIDKNCKFNNTY